MKTPKHLSRTSFLCMFLFAMLAVVLFPGRIQASKSHGTPTAQLPPGFSADWWTAVQENIRKTEYHATIDPLSESAERKGRKPWKSRPTSGSGGGLSESADWSAGSESEQDNANFGYSVATAGDVNGDGISDVIVGACGEKKVYVFHGSDLDAGMSTTADWEASGPESFGCSVGTAGDVNGDEYSDVIVGAFDVDKAYVFHGSGAGLSTTADWEASGQDDIYFGRCVGTAGDVNNDGFSDVIVGAWNYEEEYSKNGGVFVYYGSAKGLPVNPDENIATTVSADWTAYGLADDAYFGYSVGTAGNVNNDEFSDVIVGAFGENKVYVFHGSDKGLSVSADWTAGSESNQAGASFGISVGTAGDVNNDGISDVIVGAYGEGKAYVFHGSVGGMSTTAAWTAGSDQDNAYFGYSVGTAGDVNNDGISDVIVGDVGEGKVYVFHGSDGGLSVSADWTAESDQPASMFGISVGTAGDVNGDEVSDVIVGAPMYNNSGTNEDKGGRAFAYYGSSDSICFIGTASYGSPMEPQIGFVATMALMFFLIASLVGLIGFRKVKK